MIKITWILALLLRLLRYEVAWVVQTSLRLVEYIPATVGWYLWYHLHSWNHLISQVSPLTQSKIRCKTSRLLVNYLVLHYRLPVYFVKLHTIKIIHSVLVRLLLHVRYSLMLTSPVRMCRLVCWIWWEQKVKFLLLRRKRLFLRMHERKKTVIARLVSKVIVL